MLYLRNITGAQSLEVPRPGAVPDGDLTFQARSTINLDVVMDLQVLDLDISNQYFFLAVQVPEGAPEGEYEYQVKVDGEAVACGLLVIGERGIPKQYEKPIQYEQYNR
jgi:hypothetical protein